MAAPLTTPDDRLSYHAIAEENRQMREDIAEMHSDGEQLIRGCITHISAAGAYWQPDESVVAKLWARIEKLHDKWRGPK